MKSTQIITAVLSLFLLSGCASLSGGMSGDISTETAIQPAQHKVYPDELYNAAKPDEGSLWIENGTRLFTDMRARHVGDVVTVRISERPSGKLNAATKTSRNSSIEAGITDFLGYMKSLEAKNSRFDRTSMFKANISPKFDGQGNITRDGEVTAYVAARVLKVFPNGNLYINGKREIKVNNETQYMTISGIIRPDDISSDNEISSTYIADARIEYSGEGVIADKQKPGWLARILDQVWPF
jgi:flagellar L-ring protein precursor FlgH